MRPPLHAWVIVSGFMAALAPPAGAGSFVPLRDTSPGPIPGLQPIIVEPRFGGRIFGFDIDPDGTEGILS